MAETETLQTPAAFSAADITAQAACAVKELLAAARLQPGDIFVIGCSSSEIVGGQIGKNSSMAAAQAVLAGVLPLLKAENIYLAAQCCEHLNRALVLERAAALRYGYTEVNALPQPHAGGSWATSVWAALDAPVLVEEIQAAAGLDIGGTMIGMHLKRVVVPVRLSVGHIGSALLLAGRTRPKYIGGERAVYKEL
ncbi:MAG: TIGR01440 family protein [Gemmiger sp.]|nr:TIGR01440 family protein [Gemmiger sp.]